MQSLKDQKIMKRVALRSNRASQQSRHSLLTKPTCLDSGKSLFLNKNFRNVSYMYYRNMHSEPMNGANDIILISTQTS